MSGGVDVLARIQREIDHAGCLGPRASDSRARRLQKVHSDVAALVEALKEASESLGNMGAQHLKSRVDAALRQAGVEP